MLAVGAIFAAVGYVLVIGTAVLEFTAFHPAIESVFTTCTEHRLAGGGTERTASGTNAALTTVHHFPATLLWLKLGVMADLSWAS